MLRRNKFVKVYFGHGFSVGLQALLSLIREDYVEEIMRLL
jgi:hypothetical protein